MLTEIDGVPPAAPRRSWALAAAVAVLALLAYVPTLTAARGRMVADSKLYLYLDPQRLVGDTWWSFDPRQFAGWVPHQHIAYLWPSGPWYVLFDVLGAPDWVAHRLWLGTLLLLAGTGVFWVGRLLGLAVPAALAAALVYQLSPYVLPYSSRTSVMLLPWAGLGWIVGLTILAATRSRWRHAALAALVVLTVGAVNATALLMIVPAPVLWLVHAATNGTVTWRRATATAARIGVLSAGVSLWWLAALVVQGRYGADVLAYSETLESVSFTSMSTEVVRGLGYWLFYIRDPFAAATTASYDYLVSGRVVAITFAVLLVCMAGLVASRWVHRRYALWLVGVGIVLAVGVHPIDDPSPLMSPFAENSRSGFALALRSSTRAIPVSALGLALGAGALVAAAQRIRWRWAAVRPVAAAAAVVGLLAVANLPALWNDGYLDPALDRDQDPPAAWLDAVADLDADPDGGRVLQVPGAEFGAFRWGYTVDQPLPGLTERPLVTRDLLPLGSAAAMDLVFALDDRFQTGTLEPDAVAATARLLGADTVWLANDLAWDRFRTPRPDLVAEQFATGAAGLAEPRSYGEPVANAPVVEMVDVDAVARGRLPAPVPPVQLLDVADPVDVIRAKEVVVVVAGDGAGLVDAAAAGVLSGEELVRYAASIEPDRLAEVVAGADAVVITDGNRDRAHHWRSSQDVTGFTEDGSDEPAVLDPDESDQRLPVFERAGPRHQTTAIQVGPVTAVASGYGEPFAYRPEQRAAMAVDGDPSTAWEVAEHADAAGHRLRLHITEPIDHVTLLQPDDGAARRIAEVAVTVDGQSPTVVALDDRSLTEPGQRVDIAPTNGAAVVEIEILSTVDLTDAPTTSTSVGFAEVATGLPATVEVVRLPSDALAASTADVPLTIVLTRERAGDTDRWRADPEPAVLRSFELPVPRSFDLEVQLRLDQRGADAVLAGLLGVEPATSSERLTGVAAAGAWAAVDGRADTAWTSAFGGGIGARLRLPRDPAAPSDSIRIRQPVDDVHSTITALAVATASGDVVVPVPPPDPNGVSTVSLPALDGEVLELGVAQIAAATTVDRRFADRAVLPVAIIDVSGAGVRTAVLPERLDTGCRSDLLVVDDVPVPVRVTGETVAMLAGEPVSALACDGAGKLSIDLGAGRHLVRTPPGATTGLEVDRVVLTSGELPAPASPPVVEVLDRSQTSREVAVTGCTDGCWLVLGEGYSEAWSATRDGTDLGEPVLVDGGFNGWWLEPTDGTATVTLRWTAQRPLTVALLLSGLAVALCVVLAIADRRRAATADRPVAELVALAPMRATGERRRDLAIVAGCWAVAAALVVQPVWGLVAAAVGVAMVALRSQRVAGAVAVATTALLGLVVVRRVVVGRPPPDASWVTWFDDLHQPGLFAVTALVAGGMLLDRRPRQDRHAPADTSDGDGDAEVPADADADAAGRTPDGDADGRQPQAVDGVTTSA